MRVRKKKKLKWARIILVFLIFVSSAFGGWYYFQGRATPMGDTINDVPEQLTEEQESLLEDYTLVRKMLMTQAMDTYTAEEREKINEQNNAVVSLIEAKDVVRLENAINTLARLIDEPLFNGTAVDLFYARGILILNKQHRASSNFNPGDRAIRTEAFAQMQADAAEAGITLVDSSGYRSYYDQEVVFNRYVAKDGEEEANRYSARPGYSEHQTGFVSDIGGKDPNKRIETTFDDTEEAKWLAANAHKYGFIMRYPPGKESVTGYIHESWHYRYIGEIATKVYESGLTLEEYLGLV